MSHDGMVHVIDDDAAIRDSISFLLDVSGLQATTYESARAFLDRLDEAERGCIVSDIRMPDISGLDLVRKLNEMGRPWPVIIITGHADVPLAVEAMKAGVLDFLEKPFEDDRLIAAVKSALSTEEGKQKAQGERQDILARLATLTGRERDVLEGLVAGKANKIIAFDLGISPRTVEVYRANVMTKMQAASLSELVRMKLVAG